MLIGLVIIIFCIIIDQTTKYAAQAAFAGSSGQTFIPYILEFGYVENDGASLNILAGEQFTFMVITVFALGIFGYLFLESDYKHKKVYSIAIALFIGGTFGNAIDRAMHTYVIDFMKYPFLEMILGRYGSFHNNFADLFLSAAIVLFAIDLFILEPKRLKKEKIDVQESH
ncbi:MAG: signal peptidase II [Tenericutes bacterium]|jgi:signal peptidase II|nr:signal peptidase II [Mycoplasmatota bacterium]